MLLLMKDFVDNDGVSKTVILLAVSTVGGIKAARAPLVTLSQNVIHTNPCRAWTSLSPDLNTIENGVELDE